MISPQGPNSLLVIVPALNEADAIAGVVHSIHEHVPGVPVLVIDDCSWDATVAVARRAGAEVMSLPHHLGLGGAVQAGYKLAYELGFDYVIRVDGDGQHDARDIPRVWERLRTSGCEMVIGSRFEGLGGSRTGRRAALGHPLFSRRAAPHSGQTRPGSHFRLRGRESDRARGL